jgi:hypothetical protein
VSRKGVTLRGIIRADGAQTTAWVRPPAKRYGLGAGVLAGVMISVAAIGLAGCTTSTDNAIGPTSSSQEATPVATPVAIPGDTNGDGKLSKFEEQVLASHAPRDYTMPDGSVVKIDPTQPLPEPVKAVIATQSAPFVSVLNTKNEEQKNVALAGLMKFSNEKKIETGRPVIIIYPELSAENYTPGNAGYVTVWASIASDVQSTGLKVTRTKEEMLSAAQAWANPRGYDVIISE